jgi:hypothetical protein
VAAAPWSAAAMLASRRRLLVDWMSLMELWATPRAVASAALKTSVNNNSNNNNSNNNSNRNARLWKK